jgi:hypothetical protein
MVLIQIRPFFFLDTEWTSASLLERDSWFEMARDVQTSEKDRVHISTCSMEQPMSAFDIHRAWRIDVRRDPYSEQNKHGLQTPKKHPQIVIVL